MNDTQDMPALDDDRPDGVNSTARDPVSRAFEPDLGRVLLASLLFMLNVTLFFTLNTGMDLYGFYTLGPVSGYPLPAVLSTLLNLVLAVAAYAFYRWLIRRQTWFTGGRWGPFTKGAVLSGCPVLLAYAPAIVLTSHGGKSSLIVVAGLMAGSLCVTHALRDPEMRLDTVLARYWFIGAIGAILVFLALSIGGMMMLYYVEQQPATGNLLWKYEYEWSDLGYPREQFAQRQRDALVGFTLTGSGFMIAVLGGSLLGAILRWTRASPHSEQDAPRSRNLQDAPQWIIEVAERLESVAPLDPNQGQYVAVLGGREIDITESQYELLIADKDALLHDVELLVNKVAGNVFLRVEGAWTRQDFRIRARSAGVRSGPFALLCIYARYPGRHFTNGELLGMIERDLAFRTTANVRDMISQLQRRDPSLPVIRDEGGSYMPDSVRVSFIDQPQPRSDNPEETEDRPIS